MYIHQGPVALSDFRINKLLSLIKADIPDVTNLYTRYLHFVKLEGELNESMEKNLNELLFYGSTHQLHVEGQYNFLVIPRPGTISSWSSKATNIIQNCGMHLVIRVERGTLWTIETSSSLDPDCLGMITSLIHDRMTETVITKENEALVLFEETSPVEFNIIDILSSGDSALHAANSSMGLALTEVEISYLYKNFTALNRNPTDVELMMFAQANSEHCRHKIFNANWTIDKEPAAMSLFDLIRQTHKKNKGRVLSAYSDNAAVISGFPASRFFPEPGTHLYKTLTEEVDILMKVETHNHPTAISPYPGASTGSGGEIRDEAATGRGAKPKAGLTGFCVSNLYIPEFIQPWEGQFDKPDRIASALDIMLEGPIGSASFNNEFGRPALCGYFRSFEQKLTDHERLGYHKPIMIAGGYGSIRNSHIQKQDIPVDAALIVLGGPAMLIGLGGGAASSMSSGESDELLDFASVQRDNPEMQRRCQEVINACWALAQANPIISIHDVGAGGLSNALPELVSQCQRGAIFDLRAIPSAEPGMSPMEIWCNEAQERYVLAIHPDNLETFNKLCRREQAPYAVIGRVTEKQDLVLEDKLFNTRPIDMPMSILLGNLPAMQKDVYTVKSQAGELQHYPEIELEEAIQRILRFPAVADKRFLITIGDRSVTGLVVRDQMVGPWQVPVADCAVTASSFGDYVGEAMAMGERTPVAVTHPAAASRLAIGEAITNLAAARILSLGDVTLSANWMAASGNAEQDAHLYQAVEAASEFCSALGICIPVGKDSLSMNTNWFDAGIKKQVISPVSLIISAFAPVVDVRQSLTPQLNLNIEDTVLVLIDLGLGKERTGGSVLEQVFNLTGGITPDVDTADDLSLFFRAIQMLNDAGVLLAYHDRSDGGLFVTLVEMALASRCGIDIHAGNPANLISQLFAEELGAIIQVRSQDLDTVMLQFADSAVLKDHIHVIGSINHEKIIRIQSDRSPVYETSLEKIQHAWSETTFHMQSLRDHPECANQEFNHLQDMQDPGLRIEPTFDIGQDITVPYVNHSRPKIAVLREQGINGHVEMAAAFDHAGFDAFDVHMNDLLNDTQTLDQFQGIVACGGFSYGDVLGAGGGWAKTIMFNQRLREQFASFFSRTDVFGLGICNGCQMFAHIKEMIPGAEAWPTFIKNKSEQFESRLVMVEIMDSPSILLRSMEGSKLPIVVAHGEGRIKFDSDPRVELMHACIRYVDNYGSVTEQYPANPNGSTGGLTGFTTKDGRFTIMMPHPERLFLKKQHSWCPGYWKYKEGPWIQLFRNARQWLN